MMKEIRINDEEMQRLMNLVTYLTNQKGYSEEEFSILIEDKFPLHEVRYIFETSYVEYEIDTKIEVEPDSFTWTFDAYQDKRNLGIIFMRGTNIDKETRSWNLDTDGGAISNEIGEWLEKTANVLVVLTIALTHIWLDMRKGFVLRNGKHYFTGMFESDIDEAIYNKLQDCLA